MSAWTDLVEFLNDGEKVIAVVFGKWGWSGYGEPEPPPVLEAEQGIIYWDEDAKPFMEGWSFYGGYGAPDCYAVNIWTTQRVIWVTQYDGSTALSSVPRNPCADMPDMPGG